MERYAFRMRLKPGCEAEYKLRHDAIWPELAKLLKEAGISDYSIYLDEETGALFGILSRTSDHKMDQLPDDPVMRKWWDHMADLMDTEADNKPVVVPLTQVFHLS